MGGGSPCARPHDCSIAPTAVRTPSTGHAATAAPRGGPVVPTESAIAAQHPLPAAGARLTGGLLHEWQRRNAAASMPLALHQLVAAGNLANLQLAIDAAEPPAAAPLAASPRPPARQRPATSRQAAPSGRRRAGRRPPAARPRRPSARASGVTPPADLGYHGPVFMDSDIYKTLEAIGWELESVGDQEPPGHQEPPAPARSPTSPRPPSSCSPASSGRTAT